MTSTAQLEATACPPTEPATLPSTTVSASEAAQTGSPIQSAPRRAPPKVFASPKKKHGKEQSKPGVARKQSMRAKLRKALAPYVAASYLQGEMARRFTKEYLEANPPPENEGDLPLYVQHHLRELNRVTDHWSGCMAHALDPISHQLAVDARLKRLRDREEGRLPDSSSVSKQRVDEDDDIDAGIDYEGGLTSSQIFGAVHLVSDVKVWQQILAAQKAEEKRQHAIAELHMNHAARIIQRSWHSFITHKKEEQARLDALVSPDVQAMLSAAAYKAMRDARNKLAIMKLRKSLSRRTRGFGSGMPRDLDPIPRQLPSGPSSKDLSPGRDTSPTTPAPRSQLPGTSATPADTSNDADVGGSRTGTATGRSRYGGAWSPSSPTGRPGSSASALVKVKSFAARSAQVVQRLVSIKEIDPGLRHAGRPGAGGKARRQGKREEAEEGSTDGDDEESEEETEEEESEEEDEEDEEENEEETEEGVRDDDEEEDSDDDSLPSCSENGEEGDGEGGEQAAEAAIAEAEEVIQVAAEFAKAFLGDAAQGSDEDGDDEDDADGRGRLGDEVLNALSAVEAATASATTRVVGGRVVVAVDSGGGAAGGGLAPPTLIAQGRDAITRMAKPGAAAAAAQPRGRQPPPHDGVAAAAAAAAAPRLHGAHLGGESALIRQLIAGALAAAAAPVLGRKNALAMAQMGLGDLRLPLESPTKAAAARAAAAAAAAGARLRPAPGAKGIEEAHACSPGVAGKVGGKGGHHSQSALPLEIRAAAAMSVGLPAAALPAAGLPGARRSDGGAGGGGHHRHHRNGDRPSPTAFGAGTKGAGVQGRKSMPGDAAVGDRRTRHSHDAGGGGGTTVFLPSVATAYGTQPGGADTHPTQHKDQGSGGAAAAAAADGDPGSAAIGRKSYGYLGYDSGAGGGEGPASAGRLPSPRSSPTGVSAAAAAALATQPWAMRRQHHVPPGAHTIGGSLPDPRGGGGGPRDVPPREPTWLLPPIERINRSSTGPAGLGGSGAGAVAAAAAAAAAPQGMARTASDPSLQRPAPGEQQPQRPSNLQGNVGGGGSSGGGGVTAAAAGAMRATGQAAAAGGKARRSSVISGASLDAQLLQQFHSSGVLQGVLSQSLDPGSTSGAQCGFVINGIHGGGTAAVARLKMDGGGQPPPLPSALAGGGGGAGGGTAAARQVVQHLTTRQRSGP